MITIAEIELVNFVLITAGILFTIGLSEYLRRFRPDLGDAPLQTIYYSGFRRRKNL
jgi:hypothetical protein